MAAASLASSMQSTVSLRIPKVTSTLPKLTADSACSALSIKVWPPWRSKIRACFGPRNNPMKLATFLITIAFLLQGEIQPTNSLPNPYETIKDWAKLPEGRMWGSTSAVEIDKDGKSIWVAERCGANSCADSMLDPVLHFDQTGKLIKSFGAGLMIDPHGIFVDAED